MAYAVRVCIFCGHPPIDATTDGRCVSVSCDVCGAEFQIEYDPPDKPELRGSIKEVRPPDPEICVMRHRTPKPH